MWKGEVDVKKWVPLFLCGAMLLGALSGCGPAAANGSPATPPAAAAAGTPAPAGEPVYGGTLRIAVNRSINAKALDPVFADGTACDQVINQFGDNLVVLSPEGDAYLPSIATSWEISDDGMTYTFQIRDDVHFQVGKYQDGRLLTAEDAAYSLNRAHAEAWWNYIPYFKSAEAVDDTTLVCHLEYANALFLYDLTSPSGIMIPREEVEGWGEEQFGSHPIGTGPFQVVEHVPDQYVKLEKNPNYWGVEPYLDGLIYYIIVDEAQNMNALSTGEIDVSVNIAGDYIKQLKDNPKLVLAQGPQNRIAFCGYNMTHPILSDKRVRDTLSMAIDRAQIVGAVYANGDGIASALPIPVTCWAYDASMESLAPPYDVEGAKQLLAEAGYPNGFDIVLSVGQSDAYVRAATIIQAMLSQIGVNVEIQSITPTEMTDRLLNNTVELFMRDGGQGGSTDPASFVGNFLDSSKLHTNYNSWCYDNPETDKLVRAAAAETDQSVRVGLYQDLIREAMDANIGLFYATINTSWGMQSNVNGYVLETGAVMRVCGLEGTGINMWLSK